ncbi:potassium channel subfamily K member 18-like [Ptychodera flava]|uniref:potassium channel subfamily K member 18-like n=1 Tax=Ptychodera flava TaxID=63121 RepID=UPI00396A0082
MATEESGGEEKQGCTFQRIFGLLFTHVGLALLLVGYAVMGAAVFKAIEAPFETEERNHISESRQHFLQSIWNITSNQNTTDVDHFNLWADLATEVLGLYERDHAQAVKHGINDDVPAKWTFSGSLFFACTVFTTIGYGHMAPVTKGGRVFCMLYAFFGIPLLMLVLVDLGMLLARGTKFLYLKLFRPCIARRSGKVSCFDKSDKDNELGGDEDVKGVSIKRVGSQKKGSDENWQTDYGEEVIVMEDVSAQNGDDEDDDDVEFDIPVLAILAFGFIYICALAGLLSAWEDWTYFECFYFSFITLSTIGFGDYVPEHQKFTIAASVFILLGMTVMTMCITLSQSKIQHSLKWMGWRIGVKSKPRKEESAIAKANE